MNDTKDFSDANYDSVRYSDLYLEKKTDDKEKINPKLKLLDSFGHEILNQKKKKKKNHCDSYIFTIFIFLIQSLISLGLFYIFYIFKFKLDDYNLHLVLEFSLISILVIFCIFIILLSKSCCTTNNKNCKNYMLFILINLYKNIFEVLIYLIIVQHYFLQVDQLDYKHFETRAFWKISICIFYILLIIYYICKREENSFDKCTIYTYFLFAIICFAIFIGLTLLTHKIINNYERLISYLIFLILEIMNVIAGIIVEVFFQKIVDIFDMKIEIDWKVNRIDFTRCGFILLLMFECFFKTCFKNCFSS